MLKNGLSLHWAPNKCPTATTAAFISFHLHYWNGFFLLLRQIIILSSHSISSPFANSHGNGNKTIEPYHLSFNISRLSSSSSFRSHDLFLDCMMMITIQLWLTSPHLVLHYFLFSHLFIHSTTSKNLVSTSLLLICSFSRLSESKVHNTIPFVLNNWEKKPFDNENFLCERSKEKNSDFFMRSYYCQETTDCALLVFYQ
jgi:hypothetical protein